MDGDKEKGAVPSEPDIGTDPMLESRHTWLVEQCLAWGGEQRLRLRLTLAFSPGGFQQCDDKVSSELLTELCMLHLCKECERAHVQTSVSDPDKIGMTTPKKSILEALPSRAV
jgi:hypothetical protein